jgi:hypothetical protein
VITHVIVKSSIIYSKVLLIHNATIRKGNVCVIKLSMCFLTTKKRRLSSLTETQISLKYVFKIHGYVHLVISFALQIMHYVRCI